MNFRLSVLLKLTVILVLLVSLMAAIGCRSSTTGPDKSSQAYRNVVTAFYVGLAALEVGDDVRADAKLTELVQLVPEEPAGWGNWGLLALRQQNHDTAAERLERARSLAPNNAQIYYLIGLLESNRGQSESSISALRKAMELDPRNLRAIYRLAEEVERQGNVDFELEYQSLMQQILSIESDNLATLLELARISAKRGDTTTLNTTIAEIARLSSSSAPSWPPEVQEQLNALKHAASVQDNRAAATRTVFLRNVLVRVPAFRRDLGAIKPPPGDEATPFRAFLKLESPSFAPAPPDASLRFDPQSVSNVADASWTWAGAILLTSEGASVLVTANGSDVYLAGGVRMPFPGGASATAPLPESILPIDFDYDFKTDLVLAGAGGLRLFRQDAPDSFTDVTTLTKLPPAITRSSFVGAWSADIEADGDLDIVLGRGQGLPLVLRNNGDGTFAENHPFSNVDGLQGFAWADIDGDGDPDAALIDNTGRLHVFVNERTGVFVERPVPQDYARVRALNVADVNGDGVLDLLAVQDDHIVRLSDHNEGQGWQTAAVVRLSDVGTLPPGNLRLRVADVDNNGGLDLILATALETAPIIWVSDEKGNFRFLERSGGPIQFFDTSDVNGDGRLDLIGLSEAGHLLQSVNQGKANYHWQVIRPRAKQAVGDQRINSFGIGGEMEIRSGLLVQKQPITSPLLHFGLGEQPTADVVRIVWPNGSVRAEFELQADQEIVAEQRLKGSCPFLFAYDGKRMEFVKDAAPWGSAIGLRINTLGTARVEATEEWFKIGRDQLVARDGYYDLRITAELWETYYYDHVSLMAVDHPEGTEIFVDERFVIPPAELAITTVSKPRKISRAVDDRDQDVTNVVNTLDGNYLDTFGRGKYQGVTRDHYVEIDLGGSASEQGALWLIAHGWMHPTDSSINVAISQGQQDKARPLSLEVPDGRGGWRVARANLGFPAGRKKICLLDLTNVFTPGTPRRLRLRTNLEVYWDLLEWAQEAAKTTPVIARLQPDVADLHYRGYSVINQANDSSPEIPDYHRLSGSKQRWRDLVGYYTRFGDVRELLTSADDRYVIMNAGDELSLRFSAPPPPRPGWIRDFVIVGAGWIKDGDYNSTFSKTVLPLPYHRKNQYVTAPGRLEDEWVYQRYPNDWQTYHTRYVTADIFKNALR